VDIGRLSGILSQVTASINLGATATSTNYCSTDSTVAIANAALGDTVIISPSADDAAWDVGTLKGWVQASGQVDFTYCTAGGLEPIDPADMTYRVTLFQF